LITFLSPEIVSIIIIIIPTTTTSHNIQSACRKCKFETTQAEAGPLNTIESQ
jgi:hypothetical protein